MLRSLPAPCLLLGMKASEQHRPLVKIVHKRDRPLWLEPSGTDRREDDGVRGQSGAEAWGHEAVRVIQVLSGNK